MGRTCEFHYKSALGDTSVIVTRAKVEPGHVKLQVSAGQCFLKGRFRLRFACVKMQLLIELFS